MKLLKPLWLDIVKWGGVVVGIGLVLLRVRHGGREAERQEQMEARIENQKEKIRAERSVDDLSDSAVRKRLRDKWTRE